MQKLKSSKRFVSLMKMGLVLGLGVLTTENALARGGHYAGGARTHVNAGGNRNINHNANINRNTNVNRNTNINRNVNVNRNTNVNVNRNVHVNGGYYGGYRGGYYNNNHGVSTGAAVAIGVAGLAIGTMIGASQLPPSCSMVSVNGISYQQCGNSWYQPQYSGSQVNYIVVNPPR